MSALLFALRLSVFHRVARVAVVVAGSNRATSSSLSFPRLLSPFARPKQEAQQGTSKQQVGSRQSQLSLAASQELPEAPVTDLVFHRSSSAGAASLHSKSSSVSLHPRPRRSLVPPTVPLHTSPGVSPSYDLPWQHPDSRHLGRDQMRSSPAASAHRSTSSKSTSVHCPSAGRL